MPKPKKPPTMRLKQTSDGRWLCASNGIIGVSSGGDTADEAIANHRAILADFEVFQDHIYGRCDPASCERCKTDSPASRGIMKPTVKTRKDTDQ